MFRIQLLGPVELRTDDRRSSLGSPKEELTMAALAWDAGQLVSAEALAWRVWGEDTPAKPHQALYAYISRIRKTLRDLGEEAPALPGRSRAYCLETTPDAVDLHCHARLIEQAQAACDVGGTDEALDLVQEAVNLRHGEPLTGLAGAWAEYVRGLVADSALAAALLRARIGLGRGRYSQGVTELASWAERRPLDETVIEHLTLALYGSGRTAEATRLLQHTRRRLVNEAGTDPGQRLQHIQQGILTRTPVTALIPPLTAAPAAGASIPAPDNLPRDVIWVGRQAELDQLTAPLHKAADSSAPLPITAIDGMGGSGKSALAVHAGHLLREQFPDGRIFLDLRGHSPVQQPLPPADALISLLRLVGPPTPGLPQHLDELIALWRNTMRTRRAIIILDDAAGPEQLRPLLPGASPALIIVTSRSRLTGLPGLRSQSLGMLPPADAVALFESRVEANRAPTAEQTAHIVRLCDYLPLAIDITASRYLSRTSWSAADLIQRLTSAPRRLPEIRDGHRQAAQVFEISYQTLTDIQQYVFRRLGQHFGPEFSPQAAAALTGLPPERTDHILEDLLTNHLIQEPAPSRFRLHDLLREYALTAHDTGDERTAAAHRLTDHYLHMADQADRLAYPHRTRITITPTNTPAPADPTPPGQNTPRSWFLTEGPNLLATLEYNRRHAQNRTAALLVHVLAGFLATEGYLRTALPHLQHAVTVWRDSNDQPALTHTLIDLSTICAHMGDYPGAITAGEEALDLSRSIGATLLEAEALHQLATAHWHTGRHQQALSHQEHALSIRMQNPDPLQQARGLNGLGMILLHLGNTGSLKCFRDSLTLFREAGDLRGEYRTLNNMAENYQRIGAPEKAQQVYRQAMKLSLDQGSNYEYAQLQMNLATALRAAGDLDKALDLYHECLPVIRSAGDNRNECIALNGIGKTLHARRSPQESIPWHEAALAIAHRIEALTEKAQTLRDLGRAEQDTGNSPQAAVHLEESLQLTRHLQDPAEQTASLLALADFHHSRGNTERATQLRHEAQAIPLHPRSGKSM